MIKSQHINIVCRSGLLSILLLAAAAAVGEIVYEYEDDPVPSKLIEAVQNLQQLGELARQDDVVLMIEFSTPWCEYCAALEQQVLEPMIRSGDYVNQIVLRKIEVDDSNSVVDFSGHALSSTQFAIDQKVDLYPTLMFYDASGKELASRVIGITVLDLIPGKIDNAIQQSRQRLLQRHHQRN